MDKLKEAAKFQFRAGVLRNGREKTLSSQNQAVNRNLNVITINNNLVDKSAGVSECHDFDNK
jgi:hypothetical protein